MNEIQRQAYLDAIGIQSYFPRFILPNAKPSKQCQWPEPSHPGVENAPEVIAERPTLQKMLADKEDAGAKGQVPPVGVSVENLEKESSVDDVVDDDIETVVNRTPDNDSVASTKVVDPATSKENPDQAVVEDVAAPTVQFSAVLLRINHELIVVNELPYINKNVFPGHCENLLRAILAALSIEPGEDELYPEFFQWPLDDEGDLHSDEKNATRALHAFIRSRILKKPTRFVMVFSEHIAAYIFASDAPVAVENGKMLDFIKSDTRVLVTRSLNAMLSIPALKKTVWNDLQALRKEMICGE